MIPAVGVGVRRVCRGAGDYWFLGDNWTAIGRRDRMFYDTKTENVKNFV